VTRPLAITLAVLAVTGCSSTGQKALLDDLHGCERHYNGVVAAGVIGGANFSGSVKIDCPNAEPAKPPVSTGGG
jgi:hypothetical protein